MRVRALLVSAVLSAALTLPGVADSQTLHFDQLPAGPGLPVARFDGTIVYDARDRVVYLFGGQSNAPANDLWTYATATHVWNALSVSGVKPPARFGHTLVLDTLRRRLILFGGQAGIFYSDTWAFDLTKQAWALLSPDDTGPNRRYGHSGIYDGAHDRLVISHGFTTAGRFDDTWALDLATNTWNDISPPAGRPLKRCLHHAAWDPKRGQMFLYGGCSSGFGPCPQNDLWTFDLSSNRWTEQAANPRPPGRDHYAMVFDTVRDALVVFGGSGANGDLNDTWEFSAQSNTWAASKIDGPPPGARSRMEAAFAPDAGAMLFFGGMVGPALSNELWSLAPGPATALTVSTVVDAFSGSGGTIAPGEIVSLYGTALGPAMGLAGSFDTVTGRLPVQLGGVSVSIGGVAAPLYFVRSDQLNVQVPYETPTGTANVAITYASAPSAAVKVPVAATHPALFPSLFNQDGSWNSAQNGAARGSVVVAFGTGQGATNPPSLTGGFPSGGYPPPAAPVSLTIGGIAAEILFAGQAPLTAGVIQINARLPTGLAAGVPLPVVLSVGGAQSQSGVMVWLQ